jgi:hypothetical protein
MNKEIPPKAVCEQQQLHAHPLETSRFSSPERSAVALFWVYRVLCLFILLPALLISVLLTLL